MKPTFRWPMRVFPQVCSAGRYPLDESAHQYRYQSPTHALHIHDYAGEMRLGRRNISLRVGDYTLTPAGCVSTYALGQPSHHWCIHFRPAKKGAGGARMGLKWHGSLGAQKTYAGQRIMQIGRLMGDASSRNRPVNLAAASLLLQELLLWLHQRSETADEPAGTSRVSLAVDKALQAIESGFADTELTIPRLARRVGISQNYLAIHFQARTGMTLSRYLLMKRIEHARLLLQTTNLPVSRVGARVGLADPQYFNKVFRACEGRSPSVYRHEQQEK